MKNKFRNKEILKHFYQMVGGMFFLLFGITLFAIAPTKAQDPDETVWATQVCGEGEYLPVIESIALGQVERKKTIKTGSKGVSSAVWTNDTSKTLKGYFGAVPTSTTGGFTRKMWFSECPGGPVLVQPMANGKSACQAEGNEIKLSWTQAESSEISSQCRLEPGKRYYLNYKTKKGPSGVKPGGTAALIRSASSSQ